MSTSSELGLFHRLLRQWQWRCSVLGSIQDDLDTEIERNMIETSQLVSRLKRK